MAAASLVIVGAAAVVSAADPASGKMKGLSAKPTQDAVATLASKSGSQVKGTAVFSDRQGKITLHLTIEGAEPGVHAVHIHDTGDCSAADGMSAGGHWNPTADSHGKWGGEHFHRGDIGNVEVGADGKGTFSLFTDKWTIGGAPATDIIGHALIVHAKADDFTTQPTGNAGGRVACGVIEKKKTD
jgi:Cu-Zn family superoxide dismutase